jgi:WD40 repeat protein
MRPLPKLLAVSIALSASFFWAPVFVGWGAAADMGLWRGHDGGISGLALSPNGALLASSSLDGTVRLWDTSSGRIRRILRGRDVELYAVAFGCAGKDIVMTGNRGTISVYDHDSGRLVRELRGLKGWSVALAVSLDGRDAAAWGMDGRILVWDIEGRGEPRILKGEINKWGMALAWSPDGHVLAAGRASITLWDVASASRLAELSGHRDFITNLIFSPDGRLLASIGFDKTVRVWNVTEGKERYVIEPEGFIHQSTKGPVTEPIRVPLLAVAFSPDGRILATAGADRLVRLWEAGTGHLIRTMQGHTMSVTALAFSPDGKTLYSAGLDKTVRVWRFEP